MTSAANDNASVIELRSGRWQDVLQDVTCDALITDAPYSERTHAAYADAARDRSAVDLTRLHRRSIDYGFMTAADVEAFVEAWAPCVRGWFVTLTDHTLAPTWSAALERSGRYVFSPLACVEPGSRVRLIGDGPTQWAVWCVVARPRTREWQHWGSLPGAYVVPQQAKRVNRANAGDAQIVVGGKALWLMQQLVRDYSRPGDLICDPCAGGATTLLAAAIEGRRAIGAEMDPVTYGKASARIAKGYTPVMRFGDEQPKPQQQSLLAVGGEDV